MTARKPAQAFRGIEYVRRYYGVPAKRGGRVAYTNPNGRVDVGAITSASGTYIKVRFDGEKHPSLIHPTDVTYLPEETP